METEVFSDCRRLSYAPNQQSYEEGLHGSGNKEEPKAFSEGSMVPERLLTTGLQLLLIKKGKSVIVQATKRSQKPFSRVQECPSDC